MALGVGVGLAAAFGASHALEPYLFATDRADPGLYAGAALLLVLPALIAAWLPARRASRTSPSVVLRDS